VRRTNESTYMKQPTAEKRRRIICSTAGVNRPVKG